MQKDIVAPIVNRVKKKPHLSLFIFCLSFTVNLIAQQSGVKDTLPDLTTAELEYLKKAKPLKAIPVPEPVNINEFVKNKAAAIRLGKALFWDVQVGSDGVTACASCHFHAFGDNRAKNSVSPGPSNLFALPGPNGTLSFSDFPITSFPVMDKPGAEINPSNPFVHNSDNRFSSAGVRNYDYLDIVKNKRYELGRSIADAIFNVNHENVRRVEPRNTSTVINAVFNFSNFWDGRARNIFNGVNPFGELDEEAKVFIDDKNSLKAVQVRIPDASLASQAVGPPLSDFEMSSRGRTFPIIAKKLLHAKPLDFQKVHPDDSVLGRLASNEKGLNSTYEKMIQEAFQEKWWKNKKYKIKFTANPKRFHQGDANEPRSFALDAGIPTILERPENSSLSEQEFSQMEANFSLFFGLAIQMYEATLVSDDSKWDRVQAGQAQFTDDELQGQAAFGTGRCGGCHLAPEFTAHSVRNIRSGLPPVAPGYLPNHAFDTRNTENRQGVLVDTGFLNVAVRPAGSIVPGFPGYVEKTEDVGHGGLSPITNPMTGKPYPLSTFRLAELKRQQPSLLPPRVAMFIPDLPAGPELPAGFAEEVDGTQKASSLRNSELLGPYFHNGDVATLAQVVEFYTRGGNFPVTNVFNRDRGVRPIDAFVDNPTIRKQLVAFLMTLTDERVRNEKAPFDHPEILIPNGSPGDSRQLRCEAFKPKPDLHSSYCDDFIKVPAIGAGGRSAEGLPPLGTFLDLDPMAS